MFDKMCESVTSIMDEQCFSLSIHVPNILSPYLNVGCKVDEYNTYTAFYLFSKFSEINMLPQK